MNRRGWNLKAGIEHGDQGRSLAGKKHAARNREIIDDSGRTFGQYFGQVGWWKLMQKHGRKGASRIMSDRGVAGFARTRQAYSRYLGEMRVQMRQGQLERAARIVVKELAACAGLLQAARRVRQ